MHKSIFLDFVKIFLPLVTGYFIAQSKLPMGIAFYPFHVSYTLISLTFFRYYHFHKNLLETNMHMLLNLIKIFAIHNNLFIEKYNEHIVHLKIQSIRVSFFCFIWDTAQVSKKNQYPLLMFLKYIFQRFFAPKLALGICRSIMQKTCFFYNIFILKQMISFINWVS